MFIFVLLSRVPCPCPCTSYPGRLKDLVLKWMPVSHNKALKEGEAAEQGGCRCCRRRCLRCRCWPWCCVLRCLLLLGQELLLDSLFPAQQPSNKPSTRTWTSPPSPCHRRAPHQDCAPQHALQTSQLPPP